ncbi:hypothetical protein CWB72_12010 [Pseudoalteromonas phenolica]|uniref:hypothetical protein n=1 Tax=Pseudoalteromonas phenolica TaxID=161398 RepID=UPI00110A257F|nr:hypothetical protein [Pseudoalteromonas phenolica]TMN88890.1 hypothetical protein CWB72_12010 [Pseudoalteromonas phenolica]
MKNESLVSLLGLRYKILTQVISALSFFPAMGAMYLWLPFLESIEIEYSRLHVGLLFILIYSGQAILNFIIVYYAYRFVLKRFIPITNEQFKLLAWCKWYPAHWFY